MSDADVRQPSLRRLRENGVRPKRDLGQNFLIDSNILGVIDRAAELSADDVVLEIGGGLGVLSEYLAPRVAHLHVVEIDARLREALDDALDPFENVTLHVADAMRLDLRALAPAPAKVVANLPYGIAATLLLRTIGELDGEPITVQNGRYGPYVKKGTDSRSLESEEQLFTFTLAEAKELFAQPKARGRGRAAAAPPLRELGADPASKRPMVLKEGRWGPYVTDGETNASLRQGDAVESITAQRAAELLAERRTAAPSAPRRRTAAKKPAAKKPAAKKVAPKKPSRT